MTNETKSLLSGLLGLPKPVPGMVSRFESEAVLDSGQTWRVVWDSRTKLANVFDGNGQMQGWSEQSGKRLRQVVMPGDVRPPVWIEDTLFSRRIWIEGASYKAVMMLEGRKRVFGSDRLRLEHRDFTSEARFRCAPELLVAALIVGFEVYCTGNCHEQRRRGWYFTVC